MFSLKNWQDGATWKNWSQSERAKPNEFTLPHSIEEIQQIIHRATTFNQTIRVTGAGHSFSPVAKPEEIAMSLHYMRGLVAIDLENMEATFYAGTYLHEIGPLLEAYHVALYNMGDIQSQTLAGVVSTGTHGTGKDLGSFSSSVTKWGFVNGLGEWVEKHREQDDLSNALHISLGLLGILVTITIKVRPIYNLHYQAFKTNLLEEIPKMQARIQTNRHVEWYYFPGSETVQVKLMNEAPYAPRTKFERKKDELALSVTENGLFYGLSEACRMQPKLSSFVANVSSKAISNVEKNDVSYAIFPSPRLVKFNETEHAVELQHLEAIVEEIHWTFVRAKLPVHFPIEIRVTNGEAGFLSPTQGKQSAFFAFHMYKGMNEQFYFNWVHELMRKYNSRPHWGKVNEYDRREIRKFYPDVNRFNEIRTQQDPHDVFQTAFFQNVFK